MWRIFGHIFFDDKNHFVVPGCKRFDRDKCAAFAADKGIAMYDTASEVRRLKDNASDKFLEIVTPTDIEALLQKIPDCHAIVTTGQKATDVIIEKYGCEEPKVGSFTTLEIAGRSMRFWRMPSSSRAYPLPLQRKADVYRRLFEELGMNS
jgi:G:T/U-mismatch repair DNA glycosylase